MHQHTAQVFAAVSYAACPTALSTFCLSNSGEAGSKIKCPNRHEYRDKEMIVCICSRLHGTELLGKVGLNV